VGDSLLDYYLSMLARSGQVEGFLPLPAERFAELAKLCNSGKEQEAIDNVRLLREQLELKGVANFVATCPDLAGPLPAAFGRKRAYGRLYENLDLVAKGLHPIQCHFYFFTPSVEFWSHNIYSHHAKSNRKYLSFERFCDANRIDEMWEATLRKCRRKLTNAFIEIPLTNGMEEDAVREFLTKATSNVETNFDLQGFKERNLPSSQDLTRLEQLNRAAGSDFAVARVKLGLLGVKPSLGLSPSADLEGLAERTANRVQKQRVSWVLQEMHFPLGDLWHSTIPEEDAEFPDTTRVTMEGQARILRFRMRGLPEPCFLLGMLISYLRRDTVHTAKALDLFLRFWTHEHEMLIAFLPTRWLISSLQTFLDHGRSPEQRVVGAAGYFFANTVKAYEAERALEGLEVDRTYDSPFPKITKLGGVGLDRFDLGRTDLMVNTLSLLFETSLGDELSGRVLRELILRLKAGHSLFSRMDQSRIRHGINAKGFVDCWSFYEDPRTGEGKREGGV
jgi:hypothetical protein